MRTFYEVLGVGRNATQKEILDAYHRKVIENHPDKGGDAVTFMNIKKAYETLKDPETRARYDLWVRKKERGPIHLSWHIYLRSFLNKIGENEELSSKILDLIFSNDMLFAELKCSPSERYAAEVVKRYLSVIRIRDPRLAAACLEMDSACNQILLNECPSGKSERKTEGKSSKRIFDGEMTFYIITAIFVACVVGYIIVSIDSTKRENVAAVQKDSIHADQTLNADNATGDDGVLPTSYDYIGKDYLLADYAGEDHTVDKSKRVSLEEAKASNMRYVEQEDVNYEETFFVTGDIPYRSYFGRGVYDQSSLSELNIINHSSRDAVVLLEKVSGKVIRNVYIKKGDSFTMKNVPSSYCIVKVMYGNSWNSEKDNGPSFPKGGFMKNISFMQSQYSETFDFFPKEETYSTNFPTYSITLHTVKNGNMDTDPIDMEDFFSKSG